MPSTATMPAECHKRTRSYPDSLVRTQRPRSGLGLTLLRLYSKSTSHQSFAFCIKCAGRRKQQWVILDNYA